MGFRKLALLLALLGCAEAARSRLRANTAVAVDQEPFSDLAVLIQEKADEHKLSTGQEVNGVPEMQDRLRMFKEAIHFAANQAHRAKTHKKASRTSAKAAVVAARKKRAEAKKAGKKEDEEPSGNAFESLSKTHDCNKDDLIREFGPANVKGKDTCIEECVKQVGCTTIAYGPNSNRCKLYEACVEADRVEIPVDDPDTVENEAGEVLELWGILNGDGAPGGFTCGALGSYANAKPTSQRDAAGKAPGKTLVFVAGDVCPMTCEDGFTTDGTKDGETTYDVECSEKGYFSAGAICVKASECGKAPCVPHAHPTGKASGDGKNPVLEYTCDQGYSLDGVPARAGQVVEGGFKKNALFPVTCDFDGTFKVHPKEPFGEVECKAFGFVPASQLVGIYNKVFQALFTASCDKELTMWAKKKEELPPGLDDGSVCSALEDKESDCSGLVDDLKSLMDGDLEEFEAGSFCDGMWGLLSMDVPEPNQFC